jgi:hypothetical protein
MEIIRQSERVECKRYHRFFQRRGDTPGSGYGFECTEQGALFVNNFPAAKANFDHAAAHPGEYEDQGVTVERWVYRQPAVLKCDCGREVDLGGFTNPCDCGRDYNTSGQLLAPRSQWGEETGETSGDILGAR